MENNIGFKEYLISKKIDPSKYILEEERQYKELEGVFNQIHPDSFTAQKLFLINPLRRKFPQVKEAIEKSSSPKRKFNPKFKK